MRWLFRFNVGGERPNDPREMAPGLGHAMRCLALERVVRQDHSADTIFMFDGDSQSKKHMENFGVATAGVEDEEGILNSFRPTIIVLDINYLEPEKILWYRKWAPVINLAPRGLPKFYSDCTFSAFAIDDIPIPVGASDAVLHKGPQYAIVGEDFVKIRLNSDTVHNRRPGSDIVVSMGGKDYHKLRFSF